jgi:hypothetical protein
VIAEAVDAAVTLGWALLVWVLLLAFTATAALYTAVVTVVIACMAVTRGVAAALAALQGSRAPRVAPRGAEGRRRPRSPFTPHVGPTR